MFNPLVAADTGWKLFNLFSPLQLVGIVVLIALIVFWLQYRKRQM